MYEARLLTSYIPIIDKFVKKDLDPIIKNIHFTGRMHKSLENFQPDFVKLSHVLYYKLLCTYNIRLDIDSKSLMMLN